MPVLAAWSSVCGTGNQVVKPFKRIASVLLWVLFSNPTQAGCFSRPPPFLFFGPDSDPPPPPNSSPTCPPPAPPRFPQPPSPPRPAGGHGGAQGLGHAAVAPVHGAGLPAPPPAVPGLLRRFSDGLRCSADWDDWGRVGDAGTTVEVCWRVSRAGHLTSDGLFVLFLLCLESYSEQG